ncbi:phosphatidylinositol 3,4,5-trisphosphate 3-phosphatase TPTE2-like isoform X8 [Lepus europaeus]|uniref:phosphatidylinositol 3,4,5-trisphosphate 3-phosphatase TPTE2-like isoform X4 n=1 Tax=Lepus europaeus TaxID=9983 RepID=UPI002B462904|nr:phosphatidylinositol 3,4,5-trisphosphate 3-phosphatase TPTE2-like isoform X4 [Lepus europaeus]XP_062050261.1 phosphatidylinositol 3,4,5-trisphosphate 3-phosphatase TPTE2-like isoform X8 [Lepus europaeus]
MKRFKKNQYRWFSQRKNTDTDDNPLTDILVVPSQNVNNSPALNEAASTHGGVENESPNQGKLHSVTVEDPNECSQPKESTSITYVESINDNSYSGESTSSMYMESINDNSQPNESTSITFVESVNDSSQPNESTSIAFVESVNDSSQPNESTSITFVESVNDSSQPNESTSITFVESVNDSSQPNESTTITFVESVNDSSQPNESTTITFVESVNDSSQPNESTSITFVESVNDSSQPNESTTITFVESVNDSSQPNESTTITFVESVNDSSQPNESTSITFVESVNDSSQPNESTTITFVESVNDSSQPNESTTITFVESVNDSSQPNESTSITFVESVNDSSQPNESTSITFVESVNDSSQPNESTSITFVDSINDKPNIEEWTYENYEQAPSTMTSTYEYGSLHVDGATSEVTVQSDLKTSPSECINVSTPLSQSTVISVDEDVDETKMKNITRLIVSAFAFRVFGILLIFVDIFLIMSDVLSNDNKIVLECHSISLAIAFFFFFDVLLRVYVEGRKTYFTDLFNILDAFIIAITLLIDTIYFFFDLRFLKHIPRVAILLRPLRLIILVRVFHLAYQNRQLQKLTRRLVSENKRRYRRDGFDLDLTYITDRIIAMSFPSSGKQSFYRNPIKEVVRFLDTKHPNHYRVYNLCSERAYNPEHFHNRVQRIMIDDHNVPTLSEMVVFTKEVNMWLAQDKENVVVIHCKGGKGRTGTMVCACLIANQIFGTAKESLAYFASRRTDHTISSKFQGIETPSQSRYVGYFENVKNLYNWTLPPKKILTPYKIIISSIHNVGKGDGSDLKIQIATKQQTVFSCSSSKNCKIFHDIETDRVIIELLNCPILYDDIKVRFLSRNLPKYYDKCAFFFWFNTAFIQNNRLYLRRNELDNPHKRKAWKIYSSCFSVEMHFTQT